MIHKKKLKFTIHFIRIPYKIEDYMKIKVTNKINHKEFYENR